MSTFRILAGCLALGATGWGIFCAVLIWFLPCLIVIFLPGYVLVYLYWVRFATLDPDNQSRFHVWSISAFVQGLWLFVAGITVGLEPRDNAFVLLLAAWWSTSFGISVCGMLLDRRARRIRSSIARFRTCGWDNTIVDE